MIKRKKSLVPKLVAGVLLCTAFTTVAPFEAHASFVSEMTAKEKQEYQEAKERTGEILRKEQQETYTGEDGYLHRKSDGSIITGTATPITARSDESIRQGNLTMGILTGEFLKDKTDYYEDGCKRHGLDYDALVKQYYASQVKGDYPTLQKGWSKNATGQWFYSEDGVKWFTGWLHSNDGNWYYLFPVTGLMATNWDVQSTTGNCHLNEAGICDKAPW